MNVSKTSTVRVLEQSTGKNLSRGHKKRPSLVILILATGLGPLAINIILPSLPGLQDVFQAEYNIVQLTLTLYLASLAVAQLVYGPLSDRYGRRPAMLTGMSLFVLGGLVCMFAPSIEILIIGRILQAVGGCAGVVISRAIIRDLYDQNRAASMMAYVTMAMVVAPMFAPALGAFFDNAFGWRASFIFLSGVGFVVLIASFFKLYETHDISRTGASSDSAMGIISLLRVPAFYGYIFMLGFTSGVFFSFIGGAPFVVVKVLGSSPQLFGIYFIGVSIMYMSGNFFAARFSVRLGTDKMILIGMMIALTGVSFLVYCYANDLLTTETLFMSMGIVAMGNGTAIPNGVAGAVSINPQRAGTASGITGFLQMSVGAASAQLVGLMLDQSQSALPLVMMMSGGGQFWLLCPIGSGFVGPAGPS